MTTDELERDLAALAEPQPEDEHLRLAIRATLDSRPKGRRRNRWVFGGASLAAASIAAVVVALIGTGGSAGPSAANAAILAHVARASSPPPNIIVHVRETGARLDGTQVVAEWWQETNKPYALRLIKGTVGEETESSTDGTTSSQYKSSTNTIYQQPDSAPQELIDPIENLRSALSDGTAQIAGTATIDGRSLYKIELPNGVVGYFDKTNYQPAYIDNPQRGGGVIRTRVVDYEELPITPANARLLSVSAQHSGARVTVGPPPEPTKEPGESK